MSGRGVLVLLASLALAGALAQEMPDINDVYVSDGLADARLGPTTEPEEAFTAFRERLDGSRGVRYVARITSGDDAVEATVVLSRTAPGHPLTARVDVTGTLDGATLDARVDVDAATVTVEDRRSTSTTRSTWSQAGAVARLVRPALPTQWPIPGENPTVRSLGIERTDARPLYTVHWVNAGDGEHRYVTFDAIDATPSMVRSVRSGAASGPVTVTATLGPFDFAD